MVDTGFADAPGTHILMITNHGVHEWHVVPGMPDTGGQNVYVNQFTEALIAQGYRVTIVNRGGYPHPVTGRSQTGTVLHRSGRARILYLEEGVGEFVRKEDMDEHIPALVDDLEQKLARDGVAHSLIISHYWDAGKLGAALNRRAERRVPHVWVPHSLGTLKKRNMDPSTWQHLRIDERIANERALIEEIDGAVATSTAIRETLLADYEHRCEYFLPPCIDVERFRPRGAECDDVWDFLAGHSALTGDELRGRMLVTEISRTDRTKRKDVLVRAFAAARDVVPGAVLALALDERAGPAYAEVQKLIRDLGLERDVIVLGSVWDELPCLYAESSVYCTPSVMEGFGMSAQEAAATGVPVVASELVPFAVEHLLGSEPRHIALGDASERRDLLVGDGAIVVPADDVDGFAHALTMLLGDDELRRAMGQRALDITVPYFTWAERVKDLLGGLAVDPGDAG